MCERERDRERECVCVCERERESVRERARVCVCVCVCESERERDSVCVCVFMLSGYLVGCLDVCICERDSIECQRCENVHRSQGMPLLVTDCVLSSFMQIIILTLHSIPSFMYHLIFTTSFSHHSFLHNLFIVN